ncbi:hypothetical protein O181_024760 [Austropuccinia psidii MF-1]|uniref:Uncharacterized protein n=1 Tax=Austropuccinia psidii MF-1 TaxID=1389203 RepID=A0A9Q3CL56_9BASI|nr:hypothetical protein [Austropuccinia psidii MF-1]
MDNARKAAHQQVSGFMQKTSKMHYNVLIRTPNIISPLHKALNNCLIAHLGAISVSNAFASDENKLLPFLLIQFLIRESQLLQLAYNNLVHLKISIQVMNQSQI